MRLPFIFMALVALLLQVCAGTAAGQSTMSATEQEILARFFAPALLFHPDERFYPTDVFTPLRDLSSPTPEDVAALAIDRRVRAYESVPLKERLRSATVYYRVSPLEARAGVRRAAIEYFFYYLFNPYRVHGGLWPFAFNATHFHDFESLTIIVAWPDPVPRESWDPARARVVTIHPTDHGRDAPDNIWRATANQRVPTPLHVIVELGSHAMAADLDENGRFDPGIDMNEPTRFVWGIRDAGASWPRFKPGYMVTREPGRSVELAGPDPRADRPANSFTYGLAPVARLVDGIDLIGRLAGDAAFGRASLAVRLFGDTDPRTVVQVPAMPSDPRPGSQDAAAAACEHGFSVGISNLLATVSVYGGGRWLLAGPGRLPDLMVDAQAAMTNDRHLYYMVDTFGSYRLDFISRLLVGVGTVGGTVQDARVDILAGMEFRLGHLRLRQLARRNQPLRRTWAEFRASYVF